MKQDKKNWHRLTGEETLRQLGSRPTGLSGKEASVRLKKRGSNPLFDLPRGKAALLRKLLTDPALLTFVLVLILAACFSEFFSAVSTFLLFAIWGGYIVWQLFRVDRGRDLLGLCGIPTITVLRGGKRLTVSAANVVTGDVILFRAGDVVPADCRLLSTADLKVRFTVPTGMGNGRETLIQEKKSDTVYPYNCETVTPNFENLIYAGSEIVEGYGRAVAFATGKETLLAQTGDAILIDRLEKDAKLVSDLHPYFKFMGILSLMLLFPMGLVGLLVSPAEQSGMRIFLPVCAWAASVSAILPYCYLQILMYHGVRSLFVQNSNGSGSILKSTRAIDRIPNLTDLVLIGRAPLSDGQIHFEFGFSGEGLLEGDALTPLCEAFCLLHDAKNSLPDLFDTPIRREDPYLQELIRSCEFDREALRLRTVKCELFRGKQEQILDVESTSGPFRLRFYYTPTPLFGCGEYLKRNGETATLDNGVREKYLNFQSEAVRLGRRVVTVVKERRGQAFLVGCFVGKEDFLPNVSGTFAELEQKGVRVCLFLKGDSSIDRAYAEEWLPDAKKTVASEGYLLSDADKQSGVFFGYSKREIAEYIRTMKKKGRVVGVMTAEGDCRSLLSAASVSVACEIYSGAPEESECIPVLRREADALVARASQSGGGLGSVVYAIDVLRTTTLRVKQFFVRFFMLRMMQTAFVALSIMTGIGAMPPFSLVYVTLFGDCILLAQTLHKTDFVDRDLGVDLQKTTAFFRSKRLWLSCVLPAVGLTAVIAILYHIDVLSLGNSYALLLLGMVLTEVLFLMRGKLEKKSLLHMVLFLLPILVILLLSALIPTVGNLTELGAWNFAGAVVLPVIPLLGMISLLLTKQDDFGN